MDTNTDLRVARALDDAMHTGECDLSNLGLSALPLGVVQLPNLEMLSLRGNALREFPVELTQLKHLRILSLDDNLLTSIPAEIASLIALERLTLSANQLAALPPEIGKLHKLNTLTVSRNRLTGLPAQIGELQNLEILAASDNQLSGLPAQIGKLSNLQVLSVANNRLASLPPSLAGLFQEGLVLRAEGNPLTAPILDLYERDPSFLAAYLESLENSVLQYEAKLLVVGEGNTGKTSLVAALCDMEFIEGRLATHGIEIHELSIDSVAGDSNLLLHTWDFGGQEIYRITHQLFFSKNAVYLVVWKPREGQEQNEVEGWLRRIRLRVAGGGRAFVVATHCSVDRRPDLDYPGLSREFGELLAGSFEVDSKTTRGIADLRNAIGEEALGLQQVGQAISSNWIAVRQAITDLADREPQISFERFANICRSNGVDDDQTASLAEFLHLVGQVIYYGDDSTLCDFIVLNPEWLTRAISFVFEDEMTRADGGVLDHRRLRNIWQDRSDGPAYRTQYHPYFLRLMEKFDVSYRFVDNPDRSLVAQLAPYERPALPWDSSTRISDGRRRLALVCRLSEPVPGLIAWLTVRHHHSSSGRSWRNGVFLRHPIDAYASEALLEMLNPTHLILDVRAPAPDYFFHVIRYSIEDLMTRRWPGLQYEFLIPCPAETTAGAPCQNLISMHDLMIYREEGEPRILCVECRTRHDVSALLTGFAQSSVPIQRELDRLHEGLHSEIESVHAEVSSMRTMAANMANSMRRILNAISTEITDCPRIFTLTLYNKPEGARRLRVDQVHYRLMLWCEHPGHWHPWPAATYIIDQPREWITKVAPYAILVFKALKLIGPIALAIPEITLSPDRIQQIQGELDLMSIVIGDLPSELQDDRLDVGEFKTAGQFTSTQGAAWRALRSILLKCDSIHSFGGLRRVLAPSGEFLWVCDEHYGVYDPGLPVIPVTS